MATAIAQPGTPAAPATQLPGRRHDHIFFSGMALLMLVTVFVGFGPTYYLAGVFRAPLPSLIIHLHGAAFSCWVLLLITQTSLVLAGRVDIHRRLGMAAFGLACLMVVLGILAATDSLVREAGAARRDPKTFYIVPLTDVLVFATLVYYAFRNRLNPAAHKRLILTATVSLMIAAIARWRCLRPQTGAQGGVGLVSVSADPCGLRSVVNAEGASGYALGERVPRVRVSDQDTHREDGAVARICGVGAGAGSMKGIPACPGS